MSQPTVPFADLSFQWREIAPGVRADFEAVFDRSAFSHGPFVEAFEKEVASYLGSGHAIAVNSGTSALHLAMLGCDLSAGDEVLVPAHTFIATVWGVLYSGLKPVFCDVDPASGTIDLHDAAKRLTPRTKAIVPVHLYGQPADMDAVMLFAAAHGLAVVEDTAQAIGARWKQRQAGSIGRFGCYSFYPGKNLGAAGEAGLVVTDDAALAARMRSLRNHGQSERYVHNEIGYNYRMDGLQAVVLSHKLARLDLWTARRRDIATRYGERLAGLPLELPAIVNGDHVWHLYVVRHSERDALRQHLDKRGVATGLHYPLPCHKQPCLQHLVTDKDRFPVSERWAEHGLSLPIYYGMTDEQVDRVCDAVLSYFG